MNIASHFRAKNQRSVVLGFLAVLSLTACGVNLDKVSLETLVLQPGDLSAEYTIKTAQPLSPKELERMVSPPRPFKGSKLTFERESGATGYVRVFLFDTTEDVEQSYAALAQDFQQSFEADLNESVRQAWNLNIQSEPGVGETGVLITATYPFADQIANSKVKEYGTAELLFHRCNAIVKTRFGRTHERAASSVDGSIEVASQTSAELASQDLLAYAKQLDTRLQQKICP